MQGTGCPRRRSSAHSHDAVLPVSRPMRSQRTPQLPNNKNYLHFGGGQTETVLDLPPGKHTLQLLLGDAKHVPFDPPVMSRKITVTVR
jgi:hypothetical protein